MKTRILLIATLLAELLHFAEIATAQRIITTPPVEQTVPIGGTAVFAVEASGTAPLTYQWREYLTFIQFTEIPDATNATLTLTNAQPTTSRYGVKVSNPEGSVSTSSSCGTNSQEQGNRGASQGFGSSPHSHTHLRFDR